MDLKLSRSRLVSVDVLEGAPWHVPREELVDLPLHVVLVLVVRDDAHVAVEALAAVDVAD